MQSDRDGKTTVSSLVGTVLARRYKILETIDVDSFKAHDVALDQTATVRQALLTSQRAGDTWRQKVQQLALVRDPNFLNVLDVIFAKSSDFVITERPRGHSLPVILSSTVVFAALVLAVQERHPKADDLTEESRQAEGDLLLNPNPATRFTAVGLNGKSSTGEMISGQATSAHHAFTEIFPQENPSSQMESAASTPTPVLAFTPEINRHDVQANAGSWTPAHRQDSGRVKGLTKDI